MPQWMIVAVLVLTHVVARIDGLGPAAFQRDASVRAAILTSLTITPSDQTVSVGGVASYQAFATFSDGTTADVTSMSSWMVSPAGGSQLAGPGSVHAQAAGSVMVVVESDGMRATASLQIR
jgi:trimeric autotransporter adhesin